MGLQDAFNFLLRGDRERPDGRYEGMLSQYLNREPFPKGPGGMNINPPRYRMQPQYGQAEPALAREPGQWTRRMKQVPNGGIQTMEDLMSQVPWNQALNQPKFMQQGQYRWDLPYAGTPVKI